MRLAVDQTFSVPWGRTATDVTWARPPDSGTIAVFGKLPGRAVQRRVGYLPEERGLYKRMRTRDTIVYFAMLKGMGRRRARRRR